MFTNQFWVVPVGKASRYYPSFEKKAIFYKCEIQSGSYFKKFVFLLQLLVATVVLVPG